jgi:lysophospholipase L1-like esterase
MQGKLKKLKDNNGQYVYPVSVSDGVYVDSTKTLKTKLQEIDQSLLDGVNEGVTASNLVVGGNVRFKVDFIDKTISFTTWNLWTTNASFTLSAGTKTFTEMGTSIFYYVGYKSNIIELVTTANIGAYTGIILFGIMNTTVFPFAYPLNQIGVRGGAIYKRPDLGIGEWHQIGDSITFGGAFTYVEDEFYIPKITNTAVNGKRMSGSNGMWVDKDIVSTTTELITIMGGTNDQGNNVTRGAIQPIGSAFDINTFIGSYQTLIEGLLTRIPKARIILFTPPRAWTDVSGATLRSGLKDYGDDVKAIGQFYSIPVVDTYHEAGWNELNLSAFLSDGLHPNDAGKRRLSALCSGAIKRYYQKL